MNEERTIEKLREIKNILDKIGVEFWLDHGTLLSAVRDGKIIKWDSDVDLGTWYNNVERIIAAFPEFEKRGFSIILNRKQGRLDTERFYYPHTLDVDICLYRCRGNCAFIIHHVQNIKRIEKLLRWAMNVLKHHECMRPEGVRAHDGLFPSDPFSSLVPLKLRELLADIIWRILDRRGCIVPLVISKSYFENFSTIQFYGMEFKVPSDVEEYLEYRYGSNWRIPVKEWKYENDGAINLEIRLCDFLQS